MIQVFGTEWFKKYNKWIVKLAKLPFIGEWVFCFKKYGHYFDIDNLLEVQPNAVVEDMKLMWTKCVKVKGQWVAYDCTNKLHNRLIKKECKEKLLPTRRNHYFVRNEYALRLQHIFYPIWITFHIWDIITRPIPQLNLGFDTLTVYPDAGTGGDSVDGYVDRSVASETFSTLRSGAGVNVDTIHTLEVYLRASSTTDQYNLLERIIATFKTSSLTSGATISAASISFYGTLKGNTLGSPDFHICASTPAADNNLSSTDYSQLGSTSFGSVSYASFNTSGYNDITLNASGISNISKTGVSKFGARISWDILNSLTGATWSSGTYARFFATDSDYGSNKPKLVVTYTAITFIPQIMMIN